MQLPLQRRNVKVVCFQVLSLYVVWMLLGNCEWSEGSCEMSSVWMNQKLGEAVGAQTDPACRFLAAVFQSNCMTQNSKDDCSASDQCTWDPLEGKECVLLNTSTCYLQMAVAQVMLFSGT